MKKPAEAGLSFLATTREVVVVFVTSSPIPKVGVADWNVDRTVSTCYMNCKTAVLVIPFAAVVERVVIERRMGGIFLELLERFLCDSLNANGKIVEQLLKLLASAVLAVNRQKPSFQRIRLP